MLDSATRQRLLSATLRYPPLEECYRFAELVFPKLPLKTTTGRDRGPARNAGPFGEIIANVVPPSHRKAAAAAS